MRMSMTRIEAPGHTELERIRERVEQLRRSFDDDIRHAPRQDVTQTNEWVLLTLSREAYAIPVIHVLEILQVPTIVPVPGTPPSVLGIINFRGKVLSVTTIHGVLGLAGGDREPGSRIIVTKDLPLITGILVDGVEGITEVAAGDVQPVPPTIGDHQARLLKGQTYAGERLVSLLDMEQLCGSESLRVTRADRANARRHRRVL